ncbi:retropepsin-like aspartic protease family protein [Xylophilus sp.]|uniref:retropepsin-like aspartic protease family protein n=1 Tax=Xylophilus sp. TaxID=2653893 RepID=UPI0013BC2551|nr:TIGR02281 family clan AA aspartic protease [Xylophilus sp.]KAF1049483.1 MAG: hypothetical protein GAK38_00575 [Xylophilus sp.]
MRAPACARLLAALLELAPLAAAAQTAALAGVLGNKALLVVDGAAPRGVAAGESHRGVRVLSVAGDEAVVEIAGQRRTLRLGESPVSVAGRGGPRRIVLLADARGHFLGSALINGRAVPFLVDTGATAVALGAAEADRLGLDYRGGEAVRVGTANGVAQGWRVRLDTVRVADVDVHGVDAIVTAQELSFMLLGNTFLNQFHMTRQRDRMVLELGP